MKEGSLGLADALVEVRRAYRLLHAYHRRLNDLLFVVHEGLSERGLTFKEWAPLNVARLPTKNKPFFVPENWAWDLTPAYQVVCIWEGYTGGMTRHVRIEAIADNGYTTSRSKGEPDPSRFDPVEKSASVLWVSLWRARTQNPDWATAWSRIEATHTKDNDVFDSKSRTTQVNEAEYAYKFFQRGLTQLSDENAVKKNLLEPLKQWLDQA